MPAGDLAPFSPARNPSPLKPLGKKSGEERGFCSKQTAPPASFGEAPCGYFMPSMVPSFSVQLLGPAPGGGTGDGGTQKRLKEQGDRIPALAGLQDEPETFPK